MSKSRRANKSQSGRVTLGRVARSVPFQLVAAFVVLALVQSFVVKLYSVPSGSMEQTLLVGDRILVNRLPAAAPVSGDVIVFAASTLWEPARAASNPFVTAVRWVGGLVGIGPSLDHVLVKRVIAGPGQRVSCCDARGRVLVDGQPLDEPYVYQDFAFLAGEQDCTTTPASQRCFAEVTVPKGQYFVLGDHRSDSADSIAQCRPVDAPAGCLKLVGAADVVGKPFAIIWPLAHWGGLAR